MECLPVPRDYNLMELLSSSSQCPLQFNLAQIKWLPSYSFAWTISGPERKLERVSFYVLNPNVLRKRLWNTVQMQWIP